MNPSGRGVLTSQEHALQSPVMSGTFVRPLATRCARSAGLGSLVLGSTLLLRMQHFVDSAFYVAVLAAAAACIALVAGALLWERDSLVVRTMAGLTAAGVLAAELTAALVGLPGAPALATGSLLQDLLHLSLPATVVALLVVDAGRRQPEQAPDHPYAL